VARRGDRTPIGIGVAAAESVVDKLLLPKMAMALRAEGAYFNATGLPDASVTWLQTFSTALTTESGIGT